MEFSDLLRKHGIDLRRVLIMRHQPTEPRLRKALRQLALNDEATLIDYQSSHRINTERALRKARHIATFLADGPGQAIFIGLYRITGSTLVSQSRWLENPTLRKLVDLGSDIKPDRDQIEWFFQEPVDFYRQWKGKLVIDWPAPERSWYRWADRKSFAIRAILEEQNLVERLRNWDELAFDWHELQSLHRRHRDAMDGWRAIYLIKDESDGKQYVGSAAGSDNLLGRWLNYARTGHGDNALLRKRNPNSFRFTILERLPETADLEYVLAREGNWKQRLNTRAPFGLNLN